MGGSCADAKVVACFGSECGAEEASTAVSSTFDDEDAPPYVLNSLKK